MKYNSPPGLFDLVPVNEQEVWKSSYIWQHVERTIREVANTFCFREIRTPILEKTDLFVRSVGETSDIVSKEMYCFKDKGNRNLTLRPEGTAPVMRAFIEGQLQNQAPIHKLFYVGPMFRYDRPQAGRYRQHHQFGAEAIGNASPEQDAEVIELAYRLFCSLGLKNLKVAINSIGNIPSRQLYKDAFREYLRPHMATLSEDSQKRFEANPLRILDSKNENDIALCKDAPSILDFLDAEEKTHFETVLRLLDLLEIPYEVKPTLVRGLDYYNHTVFEIVNETLGAQSSIGGGGRYDGLMKQLGGPDLPAAGFGIGIERLIQTLLNHETERPKIPVPKLFFIPLDAPAKELAFSLTSHLRKQGLSVQVEFSGRKLGKVMAYANRLGAEYTAVIGGDEVKSKQLKIKEMVTGEETCVPIQELETWLQKSLRSIKQ